jgi:DNA-directed DNA polymerase
MEFKKFSLAIEGELMEKAKAGRNLFDSSSTSNENSNPQMSLFSNQLVSQETEKFRKISWENGLDEISKLGNEIGIFENEIGLALSNGKENIVFLNENLNGNAIKNEIYKELGKKKIIGYNVKELIKSGIDTKDYFDVMLAWYVLGTESPMDLEHIVYTLVERTLEKFDTVFKKKKGEVVSEDEKIEFLGKRALCIKKVEKQLKDKLIEEGLNKIYEDLESRLVPVLASMELEGIEIDKRYFSDYKTELEEKIKEVTEEIYELSGEEFNIGSPKQLSQILFEKMGIEPIKKTKTGYSTDVKVLEELSLRGIEIAGKLLDYRGYTKLLSTYVEPIPKLADENDRIHTTFHQNGTATGRLSSSNPNLQNIPARTDDGIKIRKGFISKEGWSLISFDYSQIELRVLAELSKDEHLIEAYRKGEDLHELTARKIFFKMDNEEITRMERSIAKVINFSVLYGKTPFGLSQELKITVEDATKYIRTYFEQYPKVREFLDNILENAKKNGFVETLYGTRRYIFGINSSNKNIRSQADRMAVNTVIQGTAANIIKKVMIELYERFKNESDIKMLLQVHDELIFEVKDEAIEKYLEKIEDIMENTIVFKDVRLEANGANAKNWGELK